MSTAGNPEVPREQRERGAYPVLHIETTFSHDSAEDMRRLYEALRGAGLYRPDLLYTGVNLGAKKLEKLQQTGERKAITSFCFSEQEMNIDSNDHPLAYANEGDGEPAVLVYDPAKLKRLASLQYSLADNTTWSQALIAVVRPKCEGRYLHADED